MTTSGAMFFIIAAYFLIKFLFDQTKKDTDNKDLKATVETDKRQTEQYKLRKETRFSNTLVIILIGVLLATLFVICL